MSLLKKLPKELKIFLFLVILKDVLKSIPVNKIREDLGSIKKAKDVNAFNEIHDKLKNRKNISSKELEFLIEFERKRHWDKG